MPKEPVGVFVKDGREQTVYTPAAAVLLRAQGWLPKQKSAEKSKDEKSK